MKGHPSNCMCKPCQSARRSRNTATRRAVRALKDSGHWLEPNQIVGPAGAQDRVSGCEAAVLNGFMIESRRRQHKRTS